MPLPETFEDWIQWLTYVPLLLCSVIGLSLTLIKLLQFRQPCVPPDTLVVEVSGLLRDGRAEAAVGRLATEQARGTLMVHAAIVASALSRDALREQVALAGRRVASDMERGLGTIALLASLGPLFGLLGTVVGIVVVFGQMSGAGGATPAELAGGIGTALYTTIIGLVIGISALVAHRYLLARVDRAVADLEVLGARLVNAIDGIRS